MYTFQLAGTVCVWHAISNICSEKKKQWWPKHFLQRQQTHIEVSQRKKSKFCFLFSTVQKCFKYCAHKILFCLFVDLHRLTTMKMNVHHLDYLNFCVCLFFYNVQNMFSPYRRLCIWDIKASKQKEKKLKTKKFAELQMILLFFTWSTAKFL